MVDGDLTEASGTAERDTAVDMLAERPGTQRITVGGDKLYDTKGFVAELRQLRATPHVAQNDTNRRSEPSMHALPDIAVMTSASGCASALKRYLAGARMSDRYEKPNFGARTELASTVADACRL